MAILNDPPCIRRFLPLFQEFFDAVATMWPGLTGATWGLGAITARASIANHPGILRVTATNANPSGYQIRTNTLCYLLGGSGEVAEMVFLTPAAIDPNIAWRFGFFGITLAPLFMPGDGVWINAQGATLTGMTAQAGGGTTTTLTSYPLAPGAWYRCRIEVNTAYTLVTYTLYDIWGAVVWTDSIALTLPVVVLYASLLANSRSLVAGDALFVDAISFYSIWDSR